jgi:hypothetical protein
MSQWQARLQEVRPGERSGSAEHATSAVARMHACVEPWTQSDRDRLFGNVVSDACI